MAALVSIEGLWPIRPDDWPPLRAQSVGAVQMIVSV